MASNFQNKTIFQFSVFKKFLTVTSKIQGKMNLLDKHQQEKMDKNQLTIKRCLRLNCRTNRIIFIQISYRENTDFPS